MYVNGSSPACGRVRTCPERPALIFGGAHKHGPSAKSTAQLVPGVRDHGTHGQDVRGDGGPHRGPAGGRRQVRRGGRARVPVQCWRAHHLARRPAPLPARLWLCLTRRAGSTAPHRSWTAAEEEEEEYLGAAGRAKPAAGRRVKQKGGWTEEEDGRLVRRVFGGAGWMCAAARGLVCPGPAAPSGRRDVAAPA